MPRIPSREEPYHSVAKCNRHWKTKREFVTKAANKASHVDGSHYLLICVTPKGNIEVHASEHFYDDTNQQRTDGVINWDVLRKRSSAIQARNVERWQEVERQEKRFGVEGEGEDEDNDDDNEDGEVSVSDLGVPGASGSDTSSVVAMGGAPVLSSFPTSSKASPARPVTSVTVRPDTLEQEYCMRFEHLGQGVCANVLKAWIKVVEPKKQTKFPYKDKKGNEGKPPPWWPTGMRHIEPDHLHKDERPRLLSSIIMQASKARAEGSGKIATAPDARELTISRLHFATAEIASSIPPRQHYELRQIYLIAKEVRKAIEDRVRECRSKGFAFDETVPAWSEITVEFFEKSPSTSANSGKRSFDNGDYDLSRMPLANKENLDYGSRPIKRGKHELQVSPLGSHQNIYAPVHSYQIEQQQPPTPSTSPYAGWNGVGPITVPTTTANASPSSLSSTSATYYRPFLPDMAYGTPTTAASTPAASAYQYATPNSTNGAATYGYQTVTYPPAPSSYGSSTPPAASYPTPTATQSYTYPSAYEGQSFVSELTLAT